MKNECEIVRDLLPLYVESIANETSSDFVRHHIASCPSCRAELECLSSAGVMNAQADTAPLKRIKKEIRTKKLKAVIAAAVFMFALLVSVFGYLTAPEYYMYSSDLMDISEDNGKIIITFDEKVTNYRINRRHDLDTDAEYYELEAWSTIWDRLFLKPSQSNIVLEMRPDMSIYYLQNTSIKGSSSTNVLVYGAGLDCAGISSLPRLTLGYYVIAAIAALAVTAILLVMFWKQKNVSKWIVRIALLPVSYLVAHVCVMGFKTITYSITRDFFLIMLVAVLVYAAALLALSCVRTKPYNGAGMTAERTKNHGMDIE